MSGMLLAEGAIFVEREPLRIVLLVLHRVVIPALALGAFKSDFRSVRGSHFLKTPCKKITPAAVCS